MLGNTSMNRDSAQDRCTESDYRQLFSAFSSELYELCFILTADEKLAKASFAAARERAVKEASSVFREWMWSWARRQIIKACIAALRPELRSSPRPTGSPQTAGVDFPAPGQPDALRNFAAETLQKTLIKLDVLPRLVFVMRNLEGYSARDIALLLDIDLFTVASAHKTATVVSGFEHRASGDCGGRRSEPLRWRPGKADAVDLPRPGLGFRDVDPGLLIPTTEP